MAPPISVILPVYNGEAWLEQCIRSVFNQTLTDFELLVGNDASTDRSRGILAGLNHDSRLHVFEFDQNVGLFRNLNRLLEKSSAPIVRFLCQDDILEPNCLAREVEYFETHPEVVMSICSLLFIDDENHVIAEHKNSPYIVGPELCLQMLYYYGCIAGNLSTVAARRASLEQAGGFDESFRLAGDYEMWVRLCQFGKVAERCDRLIRLRQHPRQLSKSKDVEVQFIYENRRIRAQILPLLPKGIQLKALRYTSWRQDALDAHYFVRCLMVADFVKCLRLIRTMGFRAFVMGLVHWLLTLNNHLYRPKPIFARGLKTVESKPPRELR
jgi:glycosyltransferase involved in cell wall biosynthesis